MYPFISLTTEVVQQMIPNIRILKIVSYNDFYIALDGGKQNKAYHMENEN